MKNIKCFIAFISVVAFVMITNCTAPTAGVETTNGATVVMKDNRVEGTSPPYASVYLFDTSYIPFIDTGLGVATVSDQDGFFSMQQIHAKVINVQVVDTRRRSTVLISAGADGETYRSELKPPGALSGNVETSRTGRILVYICGSGYYVFLDTNGEFSFKELPPASYKIQALLLSSAAAGEKPVIVTSSAKVLVSVISGEVTRVADKVIIQ
ncbi:MAG TPA: hypothetical protein VHO70_04710 [Chitinispirillaceae bacterium]|nr:hypothetical protein [Chitinispirillaceae bacterium]